MTLPAPDLSERLRAQLRDWLRSHGLAPDLALAAANTLVEQFEREFGPRDPSPTTADYVAALRPLLVPVDDREVRLLDAILPVLAHQVATQGHAGRESTFRFGDYTRTAAALGISEGYAKGLVHKFRDLLARRGPRAPEDLQRRAAELAQTAKARWARRLFTTLSSDAFADALRRDRNGRFASRMSALSTEPASEPCDDVPA